MLPLLVLLTGCSNSAPPRHTAESKDARSVRVASRRAAEAAVASATVHIDMDAKTRANVTPVANVTPAANAGGVIALVEPHRRGDVVNLYNRDGSLWLRLDFYEEKAAAAAPPEFRPFAYHPDYFLLALKYVGREGNRFEVIVNEETGLKKYVRADDPVLKFQTWEEHILKAFAVDFNSEENQLLESPGGKVKRLNHPEQVSFHPVEMEGDWVKVRWNPPGEETAESKDASGVGWIRWKKEGVILIELYYFS